MRVQEELLCGRWTACKRGCRDKTENLVLGRSGQRLSIREGVEKL